MTNALSRSIGHLIAGCVRLGVDPGMDLSRMIGDVVTLAKAEEREACEKEIEEELVAASFWTDSGRADVLRQVLLRIKARGSK